MTRYRKVVWNEGMLIGPHHFQQWDNYHEGLLNTRLASLVSYEWGVLDVQISREAIANGSFELTRCRAVLPDGLWIDVPQTDVAPPARAVAEHFDPEAERLDVYLAVPAQRAGAATFQANGAEPSPTVRYWQDAGVVADETTGDNERQIALARSNLRVLLGGEHRESDGYSAFKIAEVARTATGQLSLSETFVPPALDVSASPWLTNLLRQLIEVLVTKSSTLGGRRRQRGGALADFSTSDVSVFWLLHTVNSSLPRLAHLYHTRNVHPERLYYEMIRLAGELMTFDTSRHPKDIVDYDHEDLYGTFHALAADIRLMLEVVIPTRCVPIDLESVRESLYAGSIPDDLAGADFYLAVRADLSVADLIRAVPRTVKIASRDVIDNVIAAALPGIALSHVPPPPDLDRLKVGFQYFALDSSGKIWEDIKGSKTLAVYVPDEIPEEKLEMYAIKP